MVTYSKFVKVILWDSSLNQPLIRVTEGYTPGLGFALEFGWYALAAQLARTTRKSTVSY